MTLKVKKWVMAQFLEIPKIAGILLLLISHETTHPYKDGQPHAVVLSCSLRWLTFCLWSIFPPWRIRLSLHYALLLNSFLCESKNLYLVAVPGVWTRSGMWPSSRAPLFFLQHWIKVTVHLRQCGCLILVFKSLQSNPLTLSSSLISL